MTKEQIDLVIRLEVEKLKDEIIKKYDELKMRASGNFAKTTTVEQEGTKTSITAPHYAEQMVKGSPPGTKVSVDKIKKWIKDKGINPVIKEMNTTGLAKLIVEKINKEGTRAFRQGGTDLLDSVVTPERVQNILDIVGISYTDSITKNIQKMYDELKSAA